MRSSYRLVSSRWSWIHCKACEDTHCGVGEHDRARCLGAFAESTLLCNEVCYFLCSMHFFDRSHDGTDTFMN